MESSSHSNAAKPVSVIIVNFNAGYLLTDCVRSVLSSTLPVEVIVVDNKSTDLSLGYLRREWGNDGRLRIIENPDNLGFARANNIAIGSTQGDYLLFLNPDCLIPPRTLEGMLATLEAYPEAGMAGCLIRNPDGSEQPGCRRSVPTPWRTFIRITRLNTFSKYHPRFHSYVQTGQPMPTEPIEVEAISGAFMLVRRSAVDRVGVMDEGYFMHCEDLDWCMRFRQTGLKILFVPHIEIMHVGGVCSASCPLSVEYYKHRGMVRFYRKFFRDRYPALLMWLVMLGIGIRFIARALSRLTNRAKPEDTLQLPDLGRAVREYQLPAHPGGKVIVTGATSLIGDFLLPELVQAGFEVHATSRNPLFFMVCRQIFWHQTDIIRDRLDVPPDTDTLIHLAPLWTLPPLLESHAAPGLKRVIAFGSTSLFTKQNSGYERERQMTRKLDEAEKKIGSICAGRRIDWTIFRPTLVYSLGRDKNVTTIARFIQRFGFFPLVGEGKGLRQPVHAEDLAVACLRALNNPQTFNRAYNLSGGETLAYREMVRRIFTALGQKIRIVTIPLPLLRALLRSLSCFPRYRHLTPEMANRINLNMCFEHTDAARDFGFEPRRFL
jgi:GT2 family glycosyltransferase/nucleoside-diphosphate-sugar epimerase